jgi:mannose-6-phosphate isomerase-like protein (cupin superfamily)
MINKVTWRKALQNSSYDEKVGIKIARLLTDTALSTFISEIDPGKGVTAHYHMEGNEHYHILQGEGMVEIKNMATQEQSQFQVTSGESFIVPENVLHKLTNTGTIPLILMFSCPERHLDSDRYFS